MNVDEIKDVGLLQRLHAAGLIRLRDMPEYDIWNSMKQRCCNPRNKAWKNYGGRGIRVCDRWLESYWNFLWDVGRRPDGGYSWTIERIDNNLGYEPLNVKWDTYQEQAWNRRRDSGGMFPGDLNPMAKVDWEIAREIRVLRGIATAQAVATDYGISSSAVRDIWNNKTWIEEGPDLTPYDRGLHRRGENHHNAIIDEAQASEILWLALEGKLLQRQIANLYGVSPELVSNIKRRWSWRHIKPKEPASMKWPSTGLVRRV